MRVASLLFFPLLIAACSADGPTMRKGAPETDTAFVGGGGGNNGGGGGGGGSSGDGGGSSGDGGGGTSSSDACASLADGQWCDGDSLLECGSGLTVSSQACADGCVERPNPFEATCIGECPTKPTHDSPSPPTTSCDYMDWDLSPDGWYLVSQFGTSNDSTTWGGTTTCGWLQATYDYYGCLYDSGRGQCLKGSADIDWVQGDVDYSYSDVIATVDAYAPGDVPWPEIFYVAGAQRFHCGTTLRVTNPQNGRCVVVYAEDGGPNALYEGADYGGRRILDSSPAVIEFLDVQHHGWSDSQLLYVEFGLDGDTPGDACDSCAWVPAEQGAEDLRSPWDPDHLTGVDCR